MAKDVKMPSLRSWWAFCIPGAAVAAYLVLNSGSSVKPPTVPASSASPLIQEEEVTSIIKTYADAYRDPSLNGVARGALASQRASKFCALHSMDIQGWTGRILKLWSTGSGDGMVSIGVNDYLAVRSYSYAIKLSSPIHSVISSLKEDDTVSFSGQILTKKEDCFQTIMSSAMTKLDLDFFFSDIRSRQPTPADIRARQERIAKQIFANDCLDIARIIKEIGDRTLAQIVYDRCHDQMENGSWRETPNGRGALEKVERQ